MKGRKLAEVMSLIVSLIVIIVVVIFLGYDAYQGHDNSYVRLEAYPQWEDVKSENNQFILPIKLINKSKRAVIRAKFQMKDQVIEVDYLAGESYKNIYRIFESKPEQDLKVLPIEYEIQ